MRLHKGNSNIELEQLKLFGRWVLDIGEGKVAAPEGPHSDDAITIPDMFCDMKSNNTVDKMILSTYPNFMEKSLVPRYLSERAILTPTNQTAGLLNSFIVEKVNGECFSYFSVDVAEDFGGSEDELNSAFPVEYLNAINIPGLPLHELKLKVRVVVMLIRNLNQTLGLCNGTRMIVTKCLKLCVECEVICGSFVGSRHFIPHMELCPSDTRLPFKLFYVAISRVTSPKGLSIFVDDKNGNATNITNNVVYKEIFCALPKT
ncbi:uncharacterized protein LOC141704499 [Apium graveolens]|uniref:uncharacterized protein LOC141704499 n=1 Tax=Apium graveolens TaxID=4045 RepID=UPI003D79CFBE